MTVVPPILFCSCSVMEIVSIGWWLLMLPMMSQALSKKSLRETQEDLKLRVLLKESLSQSSQHVRHEAIAEEQHRPMCGGSASRWGNWETQGVVTDYETAFLDTVRRESWKAEDLEMFGICPEEKHQDVLGLLKHFASMLVEPHGKHLVVLHMEKVEWKNGANLQFKGTVKEHAIIHLQHPHLLLLVFYPDTQKPHLEHHGSKIQVSGGEGGLLEQVICVSLETRYLVLRVSGTVRYLSSGDLRLHLSVHMRGFANGLPLIAAEAEKLLFGIEGKCLTKMTPVLFMVVDSSKAASAYFVPQEISSSISARLNLADSPAEKKDEFLELLSQFSTILLSFHGKPASTVNLPLDPNDYSVGDLRPQLFNVTDVEALEWLVESHEPLVFLFLSGSKFLKGTKDFQGRLVGKLLDKMTNKLQEVLDEMEEILSKEGHVQTLQRLLNSCHGIYNVSYLQTETENISQVGESQNKKLHSLMLLKVLQTVRSYWQDKKKLSRQNRGTGIKPYCRLQELTISLRPFAEYKDVPLPDEININNCEGPCRFPQTTQSDYQTHVVLLIQLQERSKLGLARPPCCVPIRYDEQWLMVVDDNGIRIQSYPNMVAKECGCR
ncbi:hypothetical protein GDO86_001100 [Hymenochirus boettgeri]|uniref:TGF-beta family profile domain-containing protein n=1 Tax=Hymenochirus boettgeri TaxID=247094 RepID=A0A8T2KK45_9PIPI|nr:hypothetical protein GDO86_001100 [Hymenochirus boettgeri]